jgi:uncharacterized protein YbjT (DUF2867 family)
MRILLVCGTGLLGKAVHTAVARRHHVVVTSRSTADLSVDITQPESIAAGEVPWAAFEDLTYDVLLRGAQNTLLGQVELVRQGIAHLSPAGSFTLISGVLADEPVPGGTAAAFDTVFPGFDPVPVERAARAYVKSIEGAQTGQVYRVR